MNIGELDKRVVIKSKVTTTDQWNTELISTTVEGHAWAKVIYKGGGEKQSADQRVAINRVEFIMRFRTDVNARDTLIQYGAQDYDVHSVEIIGRDEGLKVTTTVRDNG